MISSSTVYRGLGESACPSAATPTRCLSAPPSACASHLSAFRRGVRGGVKCGRVTPAYCRYAARRRMLRPRGIAKTRAATLTTFAASGQAEVSEGLAAGDSAADCRTTFMLFRAPRPPGAGRAVLRGDARQSLAGGRDNIATAPMQPGQFIFSPLIDAEMMTSPPIFLRGCGSRDVPHAVPCLPLASRFPDFLSATLHTGCDRRCRFYRSLRHDIAAYGLRQISER